MNCRFADNFGTNDAVYFNINIQLDTKSNVYLHICTAQVSPNFLCAFL